MSERFPYKLVIGLASVIIALFLVKRMFFKRKSKREIELEQKERELKLESELEEKKQKLASKKEDTAKKEMKIQEKMTVLKEKKEIVEFDRSDKNPLNDNYRFSKTYSPKAIQSDKNSYKTAFEIDKELKKFNVNEEKIINLFNNFTTRNEIAHWKKYFSGMKNSDWKSSIAKAFKGTLNPYEDLKRLYNVIINKPY